MTYKSTEASIINIPAVKVRFVWMCLITPPPPPPFIFFFFFFFFFFFSPTTHPRQKKKKLFSPVVFFGVAFVDKKIQTPIWFEKEKKKKNN